MFLNRIDYKIITSKKVQLFEVKKCSISTCKQVVLWKITSVIILGTSEETDKSSKTVSRMSMCKEQEAMRKERMSLQDFLRVLFTRVGIILIFNKCARNYAKRYIFLWKCSLTKLVSCFTCQYAHFDSQFAFCASSFRLVMRQSGNRMPESRGWKKRKRKDVGEGKKKKREGRPGKICKFARIRKKNSWNSK